MEGKVSLSRSMKLLVLLSVFAVGGLPTGAGAAQGQAGGRPEEAQAQLRLRKTPGQTREYQGKVVQGEERVVHRGDSLWRILIEEQGLAEKHFRRYLVIIGSLNPQLKKPDVLQVGQTIFIPIRPDEILGIQLPAGKEGPKLYRVKEGDYLYKILRDQFGLRGRGQLRSAVEEVKGLNPRKKNWNVLFVGEGILFPGQGAVPSVAQAELPRPPEAIGLDYGRKLPAQDNLQLLEQVVTALGSKVDSEGEEVVPLQEGTIRIDRDAYPVIQNPKVDEKVILDPSGKIPSSVRGKLEASGSKTPVVSFKKEDSLHDAVNSVLARLGYQSLPANRPVEIHDGGVGIQVKGEWMVSAPEDSAGKQDVVIINLTDAPGKTPDYLRDYLALKGMSLKEILLPSLPRPPLPAAAPAPAPLPAMQVERWPGDKAAIVDSLLKSYGINFSTDQLFSVSLRAGLRLDTKVDRLFDYRGAKTAVLFHSLGEEEKKALQEKEGMRVAELDLRSLSSRQVIARTLDLLGEKSPYREIRFPAKGGAAADKLVLSVSGFLLANRATLLTDREVPKGLQEFFAEKGLKVVYFQ